MTTIPTGWPTAQSICDIPEVHEALDAFSNDSTEDNAVGLICAVLNHSPASVRAAALEEERAAFEAWWMSCDGHALFNGKYIAPGRAQDWTYFDPDINDAWQGWIARALSAAPAGGLGEVVVPRNWEEAIGEARKAIDSDEPSGWDRSGYRDYANVVLDGLADRLGALAAAQGEGK